MRKLHTHTLAAAALLVGSLLASGCTSQVAKPDQYSGFLPSYANLSEVKTPSGTTVMRWADPQFRLRNYTKLYYQPIVYYPPPKPTEQISSETLDQVLAYTNQQVSAAMGSRLKLVRVSGPGTLIFRGAITGVATEDEGLKPYDVVPVALIAAGAMAATGHHSQDSELFMEAELIDANTGRPVYRVVRKGLGKELDNDKQAVTLADLQPVIDAMVKNIQLFP